MKKTNVEALIEKAKDREKKYWVTVSCRMLPEKHDELLKICKKEKLAVNGLIKALIEDFMDNYKN